MASLKTLKVRIKSVKATQKITKAMQMVAASKLRRARLRLESSLPYFETLENMINNVSVGIDYNDLGTDLQKFLTSTDDKKYLVIVTSSDRGLCGSFNVNILKTAKKFIAEQESLGKKCDILTIGNKAFDALKTHYSPRIVKSFEDITKTPINFNIATEIQEFILESLQQDHYDHVVIIYNHFKSVISQEPVLKQLIPIIGTNTQNNQNIISNNNYEFEPSALELMKSLLIKNIISQIYHALLENAASEQGSRMSAMDNATRNAGEMINNLSLQYNRTRQSIITRELIEIISGAEAI